MTPIISSTTRPGSSSTRDRADLAFGGGVVHRDIETAKPCDGLIDHGADVILLAHVGVDELGLRTEFENVYVSGDIRIR